MSRVEEGSVMAVNANGFIAFAVLASALMPGPRLAAEIHEEVRIVDSDEGLRMRSSPDLAGKVVTVIPDGSTVLKVDEKPAVLTISGATGKWTKVEYRQGDKVNSGWVFGGFLADAETFFYRKICAAYEAQGPVEPGNAPDWLNITPKAVSFGRGGMMEANWYCLVDTVALEGGNLLSIRIEGAVGRAPTEDELRKTAYNAEFENAEVRKSLTIFVTGQDTVGVDERIFKKQP
jgi:hypothetical protein